MLLNVDAPYALPVGIRHVDAAGNADPCIRAEQIDLAGTRDQISNLRFIRYVQTDSEPANLFCDFFRCCGIHISRDDAPRAFGREPPAQSRSNSLPAAGDHDRSSANLHVVEPTSTL